MKYLAYRFCLIGILGLFIGNLLTSCDDNENPNYPNPVINIVSDSGYVHSDTTISVGEVFKVKIQAEYNGHNKLTNFIAKLNENRYLDLGLYTETYTREIEITKGLDDIEQWEFIIRDIDDNSSSAYLTIQKNQEIVYGDIDEFINVQLGAQNSSEYGSFFSLSNGSVYNLEGAYNNQDMIDIVSYYDDFDKLDKWVLASPAANIGDAAFPGNYALSNWTIKKTTRYSAAPINVSVEEFDSAHNDSILLANSFAFDSGKRKAKDLSVGDIFTFVLENNTVGMFKVVSISGTTSGNIVVDIKIQK